MSSDPAGTPVTVRELRWTDFDPLREMYYLLYEERATNPDIGISLFEQRPSYADEVKWFAGLYDRSLHGDTVARVAEIDGVPVGHCAVTREGPGPGSELGHVGILGILVHRDFRGRGAGDALLTATIAACRGRFEIVRLRVFVVNPRARALYERHGFRVIGRIPAAARRAGRYLDDDEMVLDLRPASAKG